MPLVLALFGVAGDGGDRILRAREFKILNLVQIFSLHGCSRGGSQAHTTTMSRPYDETNLRASIVQSEKAAEEGCMPFGAVLADASGTIVVEAHNQCVAAAKRGGSTHSDTTRHAEMELIRAIPGTIDRGACTLYTSTEPCVMCAGAIYWSGVGRVVYGCSAKALEENLSGPGGFDIPIRELYGLSGTRKIEIEGPVLERECLQAHDRAGVWSMKLKD